MWGEGHSAVVDAAVVSTEVGVLQRVFKCVGVGVDRRVSEEGTEEVEGGLGLAVVDDWFAGHNGDVSSSKRVFMLCATWKSAKSSGA